MNLGQHQSHHSNHDPSEQDDQKNLSAQQQQPRIHPVLPPLVIIIPSADQEMPFFFLLDHDRNNPCGISPYLTALGRGLSSSPLHVSPIHVLKTFKKKGGLVCLSFFLKKNYAQCTHRTHSFPGYRRYVVQWLVVVEKTRFLTVYF